MTRSRNLSSTILALSMGLSIAVTPAGRAAAVRSSLSDVVASRARSAESATSGRYGVAAIDLQSGARAGYRSRELFPLASVFKLAVAISMFQLAEHHRFDLDAKDRLVRSDLRGGMAIGLAGQFRHGSRIFSRRAMLEWMLVHSDNTACDKLLADLGGPSTVQRTLEGYGFTRITIAYTEAQLAKGFNNVATPDTMASILQALYSGKLLSAGDTHELLSVLQRVQTGLHRIRGLLPPGTRVADKTGTGPDAGGRASATNDIAIILPGNHRGGIVLVCLLANARGDFDQREHVIAVTARAVYDAIARN